MRSVATPPPGAAGRGRSRPPRSRRDRHRVVRDRRSQRAADRSGRRARRARLAPMPRDRRSRHDAGECSQSGRDESQADVVTATKAGLCRERGRELWACPVLTGAANARSSRGACAALAGTRLRVSRRRARRRRAAPAAAAPRCPAARRRATSRRCRVAAGARLAVHDRPAPVEVEHPVLGDPGRRVQRRLDGEIDGQRGRGDLDHEHRARRVIRLRGVALAHDEVGLGLGVADRQGALAADDVAAAVDVVASASRAGTRRPPRGARTSGSCGPAARRAVPRVRPRSRRPRRAGGSSPARAGAARRCPGARRRPCEQRIRPRAAPAARRSSTLMASAGLVARAPSSRSTSMAVIPWPRARAISITGASRVVRAVGVLEHLPVGLAGERAGRSHRSRRARGSARIAGRRPASSRCPQVRRSGLACGGARARHAREPACSSVVARLGEQRERLDA